MRAEVKRWLIARGFSERVATLVMWQAGILLLIVVVLLYGPVLTVVLVFLLAPGEVALVDRMLILLMLFFVFLALAAEPMLRNALR